MRHATLRAALGLLIVASLTSMADEARATDPTNGQYVQYQESVNRGKCFGAQAGSMTNGTSVIEWNCNSVTAAKDQAFAWRYWDCIWDQYGQYCSMRNGLNSTKCMGIKAASSAEGAQAVIWDCLGTTHQDQYWSLELDSATGCYHIWNLYSAKNLQLGNIVCETSCTVPPIVQKNEEYIEWCPVSVTP